MLKYAIVLVTIVYAALGGFSGCSSEEGSRSSIPFVVLGEVLQENTTPTVAILKGDGLGEYYNLCSGILLNDLYILTAAHCHHHDVSLSDYRVAIREAKPSLSQENAFEVKEIKNHPLFRANSMLRRPDGLFIPESAGDLAIWQLKSKVPKEWVLPIKVPSSLDEIFVNGKNFTVMGFGKKSEWESSWAKIELAKANLPYFDYSEQSALKIVHSSGRPIKRQEQVKVKNRSKTEVFLGGSGYPDTCKGDSGGPVYTEGSEDGIFILVATTSRGTSHCRGGGIYTLVSPYMTWINHVSGFLPAESF